MQIFDDFRKELYAKDDLSAVLVALMTNVEAVSVKAEKDVTMSHSDLLPS